MAEIVPDRDLVKKKKPEDAGELRCVRITQKRRQMVIVCMARVLRQ